MELQSDQISNLKAEFSMNRLHRVFIYLIRKTFGFQMTHTQAICLRNGIRLLRNELDIIPRKKRLQA